MDSTLTCPGCGHVKIERIPTDACQWFYKFEQCHTLPDFGKVGPY
jgi:hypothetical protein